MDIIYQPYSEEDDDVNLNQAIYRGQLMLLYPSSAGMALVFLPGEREIKIVLIIAQN